MDLTNHAETRGLVRGKGTALWRQIQLILEQELLGGAYKGGEKLPTEKQLSERFNVNRHTVRQALAEIARKKLIVIEQGRGAFVRKDMLDYSLARRVRFRENLLRQSRVPSEQYISSEIAAADATCAKMLCVRPTEPVLQLKSVGNADDIPLCSTTQYFPHSRFPDFAASYEEHKSVTRVLQEFGVEDYVRILTRILSRMPDSTESRLLNISRNTPVMVVESVNADSEGVPVEYSICVWASDRIQFVIDAPFAERQTDAEEGAYTARQPDKTG